MKFHLRTLQGIKNLTDQEAEAIIAKDRESHQRDLFESIEKGDYPKWLFQIQLMTEEEADHYRINPFDLTKVWPHKDFPLQDVGILELNRNPENYFAEVEQAAFNPINTVDLNLELSATGLEGKFDGEHGGKPDYDGIVGATLGVTYYFPTRGFQRPVPQIISELELRQMRDQMNAMAAANMQLQQQLANAQQPVVEEAEEVVVTDANIAPRKIGRASCRERVLWHV